MPEKTGREPRRQIADTAPTAERSGSLSGPVLPPDHAAFVEARSSGLRAVRATLDRRKKKS